MKIKLDTALKDLAGDPLEDADKVKVTLGKVLANALLSRDVTSEDPARSYVLAVELFQKKEIELNASDLAFIRTEFEKSQLPTIYKGQVMILLDSADSKAASEELGAK
jgi:hypothetical protein